MMQVSGMLGSASTCYAKTRGVGLSGVAFTLKHLQFGGS
jgi:hypothetical protein